nr:hypothetical protein [Bradyrhizobium sp. CCBAU 51753]
MQTLAPLSRLCTSTSAIPDQNLDSVGAFGAEHKRCATVRIKAVHLLHCSRDPVETAAEINGSCRHVDLQIAPGANHRDARTALIISDSCSTSTAVWDHYVADYDFPPRWTAFKARAGADVASTIRGANDAASLSGSAS